jgi:capsular exopolysaccharide synthesis family protein
MNYHRGNLPEDSNAKPGSVIARATSVPAERDPYNTAVGAYQGPGYAPGYGPVPGADFQIDLLQYLHVLIKRRWLILSIVGAALVVAILYTLMQTPLYTSTVRLQIDRTVAKVVEGGSVTPTDNDGDDSEFMKTQYVLLEGRTMAERVASALKLGDDQDFFRPRGFAIVPLLKRLFGVGAGPAVQASISDKANRERAAAGIILGNRIVSPVTGSRLVDIGYSDPEPSRAQKVAAAYADAFVASNLDKRFQANSYAKTFLEDQIAQLKLRLEQSEKALIEFGQQQQIVQTSDKASIAENNLASANAALGQLVSERIKNEQLWKQLESAKAIDLPQLLTNPVIEALRAKRSTLQIDYQQKLETFKPSYPAMVELSNQIADIDRQLATEVNTLRASYKAAYESSLNQENEMKKRIEALRTDALDLQKRSIEYNILKREVDTNRSLYDGLLQRYKQVDIAGGVGANNVFVVDAATLPGAPSSPRMSRALLIAGALGLAAGLAAALVLEHLDDTLRSPEQVERALGYATLGIIPKLESAKKLAAELSNPRSHTMEAYRSLCTALQLSTEHGLPKTLLVTSAGPSEGKSTTALTVARHFAKTGLKVLLVDADLRKPSLHKRLHSDNSNGLSNYLTGNAEPPELLQKTDIANLAFMASGPLPPNAADLLGSSRFLSLLSVGMEVFDLIVVDSPPVMGLADAPLLSSAVSATIFVVGAGQVRTKLIGAAIKRLQFSRASLIGTVLTRFDVRSTYGYGYAYGFGGGYGAGDGYSHGSDDPAAQPSRISTPERQRPKLTRA